MKRNAIGRIVIYSILFLLLLGILLAGMGLGNYVFHVGSSGTAANGPVHMDAAEIRSLKIDWAAGSVTVQAGDVDQIVFEETGAADESDTMTYVIANDKLSISYYQGRNVGFMSQPSKDLTVTVPRDWLCRELELDCADVEVTLTGLTVETLEIDGASCDVSVNGAVEDLSCDGASCKIDLICTDRPREIDLDGASCSLKLTLPKDCGFALEMDGLSCEFDSDLDYTYRDEEYRCGDGYCEISVDGMSCKVEIGTN